MGALQIKFGTDGWRAIIAQEFTTDHVARVALGTAEWILKHGVHHRVVIGHDCRFGGSMFVAVAADVFASRGIEVHVAEGFVSTPMISMGALELRADLGVIITASHNPPSYNGYKLKSNFGGPSSPAVIAEVESLIPDEVPAYKTVMPKGALIHAVDLEALYLSKVYGHFDMEAIGKLHIALDAMFGAGQRVFDRLFPHSIRLRCTHNPGFEGLAPEPIERNLKGLSQLVAESPGIIAGLAVDGDADRIGMFDEQGRFVDAHHIILLLIHYLHKYKQYRGKVVIAFSVSDKIKKLCQHYGIDVEVTKIGFKYISEIMVKEEVLVGGEESGGIAIMGHIPERDGIWDGLTLLELMAKTGKSLTGLIEEVYAIVGSFAYDRYDLHLTESQKQAIIAHCRAGDYEQFDGRQVERVETLDGFKYHLSGDATLMIRASGTEPLLRVYGEAPDRAEVQTLLVNAKNQLLESVAAVNP